jgi:ArsR family transcriptional regulator, arsenate/arsenite/antimonite-responsive transcriptional repressor
MNPELYSPSELRTSAFAKALGHPARVVILKLIAEKGECTCGELVEQLPLAQSTVSQHLAELKKARLISLRVRGAQSNYRINAEVYGKRLKAFTALSKSILK